MKFFNHIYVFFVVRSKFLTVLESRENFASFLFSKDFDQSKIDFRGFFISYMVWRIFKQISKLLIFKYCFSFSTRNSWLKDTYGKNCQILFSLFFAFIFQNSIFSLHISELHYLAYDLGMLETPYPVRSAKLSNIQSWPDLDGWSPDKSCHDVVG